MDKNLEIRRAILSVTDKTGIIGLARFLVEKQVELISTGGTAKALEDAGIPFTPIEKVTGNPEAFGGRMKSISFPVASGILYRRGNATDESEAKNLGIKAIDLVVCNLYAFEKKAEQGASEEDLVEAVDIGGPTMIRSAAKNFASVGVLVSPDQYPVVMQEIDSCGGISLATRRALAAQAFQRIAAYDVAIAAELGKRLGGSSDEWVHLSHAKELRYGENPHQKSFFYRSNFGGAAQDSVTGANIIQGKPLSFNNIRDIDAAHRAASDAWIANSKVGVACAIIKHMNPCGLAVSDDAHTSLELAWAGDPVSAFGSVICFSGEVTKAVATWLGDKFVEAIVAPYIEPEALTIFAKKKNLRVLLCAPKPERRSERMLFSVSGGVLVQEEDEGIDSEFRSVTKVDFPKSSERLAKFGVVAAKHLKSNAIALVREDKKGFLQMVAAGMGQPNRVDCIRLLAAERLDKKIPAGELLLASDAFFPFADNVEAVNTLGVTRVVQPGGSLRDNEVIEAADRMGIAMAFTGRRHFRH